MTAVEQNQAKKRKLSLEEESIAPNKFPFSPKAFYLNKKCSDIHFTFKSSDERVSAHKVIFWFDASQRRNQNRR